METNRGGYRLHATAAISASAAAASGDSSTTNHHHHQQQQQMSHSFAFKGSGGSSSAAAADSDANNMMNIEQQEDDNRKLRLQVYVFVLRCISYPFNAKQTNANELIHQQLKLKKLKKTQLEQIIQLHTRFIKSSAAIQQAKLDDLHTAAHLTFNRKFLSNERLKLLVESECCSHQDLRELFKQNAKQILKEARQQLQQTNSILSASNVTTNYQQLLANEEATINSWLIKFESVIREETDGLDGLGGGGASALYGVGSAAASTTYQQQQQQQLQQQQTDFTKEQLYQMFQIILNIKKFEHQLLHNALQLDSSDEQAAAIRRELDGRVSRIVELERNKKLMPKFVLKEMESLYLEESRMAVNKLMVNLESWPVVKGGNCHETRSGGASLGLKFRRHNNRAQSSLTRDGLVESTHPSEPTLTKLDVVLTFNVEVIVMEVRGLRHLAPQREIYCTMEIEGTERLQTEHVQAKKPLWDTQGDFVTNHPLPVLKIKLYAVNPSMLSLEDKELGKLVLRPTVLSPKTPEWCTMIPSGQLSGGGGGSSSSSCSSPAPGNGGGGSSSNTPASGGAPGSTGASGAGAGAGSDQDQLKIRVTVRMDRPQQLKHCGYLYGIGKSTWQKLKRRYHILIQVSQYTFVMCSYRDKKSKPTEMLQLDGYTVDYIEPPTDLIMEHCSEITSSELHNNHHHHHHSSSSSNSSSSPFGLAGRLANVILKQPSNAGGGGNVGGNGATTLSGGSANLSSSHDYGDGCASSSTLVGGGGSGAGCNEGGGEQPSAIQTAAAMSDELHSKYYFNVVKEGDSVVFACDDEQECFGWVMALYRATGQAHKPTPLRNQYSGSTSHYIDAAFAYQTSATQTTKLVGNTLPGSHSGGHSALSSLSSMLNGSKGSKSSVDVADQRARKHGMDEFISADPCKFQHNHLFKYLQQETLKQRLQDPYCSLGWFSPGQIFVLDEYCARYGVRTCYRHLAYLNSLLDFNQRYNYFIDHTLLNYGYDFCASHVSGNSGQAHPMGSINFDLRPDGVGTVTVEERDLFMVIKQKLLKMIERQISNFSYCFPYGKPDGALKATLSLLERVLMKEQQTTNSMIQNEEVRQLIRKCLEQAALNNYTKLSGQANLLIEPPNSITLELFNSTTANSLNNNNNNQALNSPPSGNSNDNSNNNNNNNTSNYDDSTGAGSIGSPSSLVGGAASSFVGRLRTSSNLSNSSLMSYASSSGSSSSPANNNNLATSSLANNNNNNSFRSKQGSTTGTSLGTTTTTNQLPTTSSSNLTPPVSSGAAGAGGGTVIMNNDLKQLEQNSSNNKQQQCLTMAMIINNEHIKPRDKLKYLIRLAELCCEQVKENNDYFSDSFAWHSDLMMDHFELFWSLFSVDMDKILNELNAISGTAGAGPGGQQQQQQLHGLNQMSANYHSAGSSIISSSSSAAAEQQLFNSLAPELSAIGGGQLNRDVFALFQVLNNHIQSSPNLECRKFKTYLCDSFKPRLLHYIDIMESTLTRMLFKACEKDCQINCQLVEQMFVRLDDLQRFVLYKLHWPDDHLAEQLHQRLKLIAYELCDAIVQRTLQAFQQSERRSNKWTTTQTNYSSPNDMIQMINLALETRNKSLKLCTFNNFDQMSYHSKIDKLVESALAEMQPGIMTKMLGSLESTLSKLARYDEGNLLAPILSLTYKQGMSSSGRDIGKQYVSFVSNCCDALRAKINDELWIVNLLEEWYEKQMSIICTWLGERLDHSLHDVQLIALTNIMPKVYADMSLQGVSEDKLNLKTYQTVMNRLKMEEASANASGGLFEQPQTSIFTSSILSSLTSSGSSNSAGGGGASGNAAAGAVMSTGSGPSSMHSAGGGQQTSPTTTIGMGVTANMQQLQGVGSTGGGGGFSLGSLGTPLRQPPMMQKLDSLSGSGGGGATIQSRRFPPLGSATSSSGGGLDSFSQQDNQQQEPADNIADRALQGATRMFKGLWSS